MFEVFARMDWPSYLWGSLSVCCIIALLWCGAVIIEEHWRWKCEQDERERQRARGK